MTIFGITLDGADVERALLAHLEAWMPTYIAEVRRQKDPAGTLWPDGVDEIGAYARRHFAAENWPEDQLPCLIAHSPGMPDEPRQEGDGKTNARYAIDLLAIAEGGGDDSEGDAKELGRLYASAARMAVMQHPDLGGFASGIALGREEVYPVRKGIEAERNLMAVAVRYVIEVESILDVTGGPPEPLDDPEVEPDPWPTVKEGGGSVKVEALREGSFFPPES